MKTLIAVFEGKFPDSEYEANIQAAYEICKTELKKRIEENKITIEKFQKIVSKYGEWELLEQEYNTYRGSRNLRDRSNKVQELLWLIKKH
jgi:adenine-specific DNA methylase